ncbi:hypothetical protein GL218_00631 [Daldinia childiae]|uniref:uncharacterized protein n=1 Tax=Daldinia childiae TaxID=326645 RepID=UPI001445CBAF|nr:uncharacterized protein GL218_00631 [Daldinia childiae]KAF3070891.1 hypothetical protein GL218_00631 [Daldinia childiae]
MDRCDNQPKSPTASQLAAGGSPDTPVPTSPTLSTLSSIYPPRFTAAAPRSPPVRGPRNYPETNDSHVRFHLGIVPRTWLAPRDPDCELPSIFSSLEVYKGEDSDNNGLDAAQSAIGHAIEAYKKSILDELEENGTVFGLRVQLPPDGGDYGVVRETVEYEAFEHFDRLQAALAAHEFREHGVPRERREDFFGPLPPRDMHDTRLYTNRVYIATRYSLESNDPRDIINSMWR